MNALIMLIDKVTQLGRSEIFRMKTCNKRNPSDIPFHIEILNCELRLAIRHVYKKSLFR